MIQLQDQEGRVTSVLCFLLLLTYHASRDALITALPTIAACSNRTNYTDLYTNTGYAFRGSVHRIDSSNSPLSTATRLFTPGDRSSHDVDSVVRSNSPEELHKDSKKQDGRPAPMRIVLKSKDGKLNYDQIAEDILAYQKQLDSISDAIKLDEYKEDIRPEFFEVQRNARQLPHPPYKFYSSGGWVPEDYQLKRVGANYPDINDQCSESDFNFGHLQYKSGWNLAVQGSVLSVLHWLTIPGLILGYYCSETSKVSEGVVGAVFTLQWGVLSLLTQLFEGWGPVALTALRAWQGLTQGACYPCVYRLLEARSVHSRTRLVLIFMGVFVGSALGITLGTSHDWFIPFYGAGGLAIAVGITLLFLAPGPNKLQESCPWRLVLQRDVVVSAMMHGGGVWVMHTLLIVPTMVVSPDDRWWVLLVVVTAGGATSQLLEAAVEYFVPSKGQPARGHLLATVVVGFVLTVGALSVVAIKGSDVLDHSTTMLWALLGATTGTVFGMGVTSIGYRQVLEAASPNRRSQALVCVNAAGAAGAAMASLLLPTMTQAGEQGGYMSACLLPLSLVVAAAVCAFIWLIFPTTKEDDLSPSNGQQHEPGVYVIPLANGHAGGGVADAFSQRSGDNKSFKSFRSLNSFRSFKSAMTSASFKSAVSRPRARTSSFNTVLEMAEDDLCSLPDEDSVDCRSVLPDTEEDMHSLASVATSYRSTMSPQLRGGVPSAVALGELSVTGDRTSAWLHLHHHVDVRPPPPITSLDQGISTTVHPLPGLLV